MKFKQYLEESVSKAKFSFAIGEDVHGLPRKDEFKHFTTIDSCMTALLADAKGWISGSKSGFITRADFNKMKKLVDDKKFSEVVALCYSKFGDEEHGGPPSFFSFKINGKETDKVS